MKKYRVGRVEQARTLVEVVRAHAVREHEQRIRGEYRGAEGSKLFSVRAEQHERKGHAEHSHRLQVHEGGHVDGDLPKHRCQERLGAEYSPTATSEPSCLTIRSLPRSTLAVFMKISIVPMAATCGACKCDHTCFFAWRQAWCNGLHEVELDTNASDGLVPLLPRIDKVEELRHGKEQGTCPPCHCGGAQEQPCHPAKVADGETDVEADPESPAPPAEGQPLEVDGGAHWPTDNDVEVFSCDHGGEYGLLAPGRGSEQARDANNAAGHIHCIPSVLAHCVHAFFSAPKRARRLNIARVAAHKPPLLVERRERGVGIVLDVLVQDARQERCAGSERAVGVASRFPKQGLTASTGEGVVEDTLKEEPHAIDLLLCQQIVDGAASGAVAVQDREAHEHLWGIWTSEERLEPGNVALTGGMRDNIPTGCASKGGDRQRRWHRVEGNGVSRVQEERHHPADVAAHDGGAVARERHAVHPAAALHLAQLLARRGVPERHLVVLVAAHDGGAVARERHTLHRATALQLAPLLARLGVPEHHLGVIVAAHDGGAVARERHAEHLAAALHLAPLLAGHCVPERHLAVMVAAQDGGPVARERHA
eukprot:scaffold54861_cov68-Phaeocystis_antarctica.AAC.2